MVVNHGVLVEPFEGVTNGSSKGGAPLFESLIILVVEVWGGI